MAETRRTLLERIDHNSVVQVALLQDVVTRLDGLAVLGQHILTLAQQTKDGINMANQQITDLISQFNTATNDIAARIQRLLDAISSGVVSSDQLAELGAIRDHLVTLGQDPTNPVPAPAT